MPNEPEKAARPVEEPAGELQVLKQQIEELRRDRAKAERVIDQQRDHLHNLLGKEAELRARVETLTADLKAQKRLLSAGRAACRKRGRCFDLRTEPKPVLTVGQKIVRETKRLARRLGFVGEEQAAVSKKPTEKPAARHSEPERYRAWIKENEPGAGEFERLRKAARTFSRTPRISLIVPVFQPPPEFWGEFLDSVGAQLYEEWELCLAVVRDGLDHEILRALQQQAQRDPRLNLIELPTNLGIAENTNAALRAASGDYITFADQDDKLAAQAFYRLAEAIGRFPEADIFYSDEDRLGPGGERHSPFFKPEWSPDLLLSSMYLGHLTVYRRRFLEERVGLLRREFDLSQDYDLALRATELARSIVHVPHVLYHWREHPASGSTGGKPEARRTNLAALADAMRRRGLPADVMEYPRANRARIRPIAWPKVSIVVPTDSLPRARAAATELPAGTSYSGGFEVIIVTNGGIIEKLRSGRGDARVRFVLYNKPFNFSEKCNLGAKEASGSRLIFLNDDVSPNDRSWIEEVTEPLENPEIGAVSPKLLYEDGRIQHAGLVMGVRELAGTAFHQFPAETSAHHNLAQTMRTVAALSGACLAMRKNDFFRVGGFDAVNTPVAHSDIDLCFKLREAGWRCVYTPFTTLRHTGHVSIGFAEKEEPAREPHKASIFLLQRWAGYSTHDPYFTTPMRDWLFADSPTPIRMSGRNKPEAKSDTGNLLFTSHELSLSGAPMMLLNAARWCQEHGFFAAIMSPKDGPLREHIEEAGLPLIIDPLITTGHDSFLRFARPFDLVIANTIFSEPIVTALAGAGPRLLWWMHETQAAERYLARESKLRAAISLADLVLAPSEASAVIYRPHTDRPVRVIRNAVANTDFRDPSASRPPHEPLRILLLGSIEPRKGQDVFLDAIAHLPGAIRERFAFTMAGRSHDPKFAAMIRSRAREVPQVRLMDALPHPEALGLIQATDVIVFASRDEAMPTVTMLEAMSLGRPIVSTTVGGALEFLRHEENALLISSEAPEMLANAWQRLLRDPRLLAKLSVGARATFEQRFQWERFGGEFVALLNEILSEENVVAEAWRGVATG